MELIDYSGISYPAWTASGNAARFIMPFALEVCKGFGVDVGGCKKEWKFPGSVLVDPVVFPHYTATTYPYREVDYVFSSHCLEHISDWVGALMYWIESLKSGGVLFLYLPHPDQEYWRPWNNRKHVNMLTPTILRMFFEVQKSIDRVFISERDLNYSFAVVAIKR
jgi:SAM-dependent methyltransferase